MNFKSVLRKITGLNSFYTSLFFGGRVIDSGPYERGQLAQVYENSIEARTIIDKYKTSFASIPIKLINTKTKERVDSDWRLDMLKRPNPIQTQKQYEEFWALQYAIFNENFIYRGTQGVGLDRGKPQFIQILHGQYVSFELSKTGMIEKYVNSTMQTTKIDTEEVVATIGDVLDPVITMHATSKLITASKILKKLEEGHINELDSFGNKGIGALISAKVDGESFSPKQHANLLERFNNPKHPGGIEATSAAVEVHQIAKSPVDLGVLESSKDSRKVLALLYNIPLPLVSDDASTYNNMDSAQKSYVKNVLIPDKTLYCEKLNELLNCAAEGVSFVVDVENIEQLKDKPKDILEAYNIARASINERRKVLGLPELEGEEYDLPVLGLSDQVGIAPDLSLEDLGGGE